MTYFPLADSIALYHADARDALRALPDNCLDSCCTDPPYALVSIVKRFGSPTATPAKGNDAYMRASAGFMNKTWDTGECAMSADFWAEVLRVLKPGAHLAAFGATRGYHRMACAIEDAGFEIRDSLAWMYGVGFPKSQNVSLQIDKQAGAEREAIGSRKLQGKARVLKGGNYDGGYDGKEITDTYQITAPATPEAREWQGFGTALKPAFEPIVLARKPLSEGTVAANVLRWRTGALNIDGCRIETAEGELKSGTYQRKHDDSIYNTDTCGLTRAFEYDGSKGRWPANVCHDGSDEVVRCFPSTAPAKAGNRGGSNPNPMDWGNARSDGHVVKGHSDSGGSAARFFYSAKASKADRAGSKHPTVKPIALMQWLCRLITPPGGAVLDPFAGSGTTGAAALAEGFCAVLIEREAEYVADIQRRFLRDAA